MFYLSGDTQKDGNGEKMCPFECYCFMFVCLFVAATQTIKKKDYKDTPPPPGPTDAAKSPCAPPLKRPLEG